MPLRILPKPFTRGWKTMHILFMSYALFLLVYSSGLIALFIVTAGPNLHGQDLNREFDNKIEAAREGARVKMQLDDLDRRVLYIEQLNVDRRLTVIETLLKEINSQTVWGPLSMGGTGLLIFRHAYLSLLRRRNKRAVDSEDDED